VKREAHVGSSWGGTSVRKIYSVIAINFAVMHLLGSCESKEAFSFEKLY